jgi:hypothetical protein
LLGNIAQELTACTPRRERRKRKTTIFSEHQEPKDAVLAVRFKPDAFFFRLNHQTISTKNAHATQTTGDWFEESAFPCPSAKS